MGAIRNTRSCYNLLFNELSQTRIKDAACVYSPFYIIRTILSRKESKPEGNIHNQQLSESINHNSRFILQSRLLCRRRPIFFGLRQLHQVAQQITFRFYLLILGLNSFRFGKPLGDRYIRVSTATARFRTAEAVYEDEAACIVPRIGNAAESPDNGKSSGAFEKVVQLGLVVT